MSASNQNLLIRKVLFLKVVAANLVDVRHTRRNYAQTADHVKRLPCSQYSQASSNGSNGWQIVPRSISAARSLRSGNNFNTTRSTTINDNDIKDDYHHEKPYERAAVTRSTNLRACMRLRIFYAQPSTPKQSGNRPPCPGCFQPMATAYINTDRFAFA
jgi:hypothetical protein